jgi:integrase
MIGESPQERQLAEIRDRYLADLGTYAKPSQVTRIGCVTKKLIEAVGNARVRDLRIDAVLLYRQKRTKQGAAARTINLEVGGFKAMLTWATKAGLIGRNPIANLTPLPAGKANEVRPRRAMTADEIERFLRAADDHDRDAEAHLDARPGQQARYGGKPRVPQTPLWRALLYTGARWGELVATTWADFDADARTLRLRSAVSSPPPDRSSAAWVMKRSESGSAASNATALESPFSSKCRLRRARSARRPPNRLRVLSLGNPPTAELAAEARR